MRAQRGLQDALFLFFVVYFLIIPYIKNLLIYHLSIDSVRFVHKVLLNIFGFVEHSARLSII